MKNLQSLTTLVAFVLVTFAAASVSANEGVSPGSLDRIAAVEARCPTFSWGADDGAAAYEVVAYVLPEDVSQQVELTAETEVLYTRVAGSATSWTPSAEQCFAPGGRYVWFVRAATKLAAGEVVEAGEWSAGRYFGVPAGPTSEELARALEVLKRWEAANGDGSPPLFTAAAAAAVAAPAPAAAAASGAGAGGGSGTSHPKSVPTASAAIRGEHPDAAGEKYGVIGTSASPDGAGLAAANLGGGPDLVLDGSANGATDARLWEGGLDRPSAVDQSFVFANSGSGLIDVHVQGDLSGGRVTGDELWVPYGMVVDDEGQWQGVGDTVPCAGCVSSSDIADGAVATVDLASGSVTNTKIAAGAVGASAIRSNAITNSHLADDAVTGAEILDGSITAADVVGGGLYSSKTQLYEREVTETFPAVQGVSNAAASCDDANDLALSGSCYSILTSGIELFSTADSHWSDPAQPAVWTCWFYNRLAMASTIKARILCLSVP